MEKKEQIRQNMIKSLKNFDFSKKKQQTDTILADLLNSKVWKEAQKVALYMAEEIEFDLKLLFAQADKEILIPKTLPKRQMIFVKYDKDKLERTKYGLLEPISAQAEVPDLILVPGLAWNAEGYRIGFGGGYYDRYLADFSGQTVSVCYDFQNVEFEPETHDIKVGEVFSYEH